MIVKAKQNSSQRTKNRIKERGPVFQVGRESKSCPALDGVPAVLLETPSWARWIPLEEIEIFEE